MADNKPKNKPNDKAEDKADTKLLAELLAGQKAMEAKIAELEKEKADLAEAKSEYDMNHRELSKAAAKKGQVWRAKQSEYIKEYDEICEKIKSTKSEKEAQRIALENDMVLLKWNAGYSNHFGKIYQMTHAKITYKFFADKITIISIAAKNKLDHKMKPLSEHLKSKEAKSKVLRQDVFEKLDKPEG